MLKIQSKENEKHAYWIMGEIFRIGADPENDWVLDDESISAYHATLLYQNGRLRIHDHGSESGSYVNGKLVKDQDLKVGDTICFAGSEMEIINPLDITLSENSLPENLTSPWVLVALSGKGERFAFPLSRGRITLGRDQVCDIVISGSLLSGQHCCIMVTESELKIIDLESANGTFVNEKRVMEKVLADKDVIRLDTYQFQLIAQELVEEQYDGEEQVYRSQSLEFEGGQFVADCYDDIRHISEVDSVIADPSISLKAKVLADEQENFWSTLDIKPSKVERRLEFKKLVTTISLVSLTTLALALYLAGGAAFFE